MSRKNTGPVSKFKIKSMRMISTPNEGTACLPESGIGTDKPPC